jgi:hypothetical protein
MGIRKAIPRLLSAAALMLGFTPTPPAVAKEPPPATSNVEFDSDGRVGVSDRDLLKKMGIAPQTGDRATYDLRLSEAVRVSGTQVNIVC